MTIIDDGIIEDQQIDLTMMIHKMMDREYRKKKSLN